MEAQRTENESSGPVRTDGPADGGAAPDADEAEPRLSDFHHRLQGDRLCAWVRRRQVDDRAVTPEVGVTILLGIVTVLGSMVGVMAFNLSGDQPENPGQAVWDAQVSSCANSDDGVVRLHHRGGQAVSSGPLVLHYRWDNNSTKDVQRIDLGPGDRIEAGDLPHERRVDEPRLLTLVTLVWETSDESYLFREFEFEPPFPSETNCFGTDVDPGFVVQGDEQTGDCDGSSGADDAGHGNECDGEDEDNPGGGGGANPPNGGSP
jgi:hypothetical protein